MDRALWETYRVALAKVLGERRDALRPLVQGKRRVVPQRWRNMVSELVGRDRADPA